jgi:hypothetical protein
MDYIVLITYFSYFSVFLLRIDSIGPRSLLKASLSTHTILTSPFKLSTLKMVNYLSDDVCRSWLVLKQAQLSEIVILLILENLGRLSVFTLSCDRMAFLDEVEFISDITLLYDIISVLIGLCIKHIADFISLVRFKILQQLNLGDEPFKPLSALNRRFLDNAVEALSI